MTGIYVERSHVKNPLFSIVSPDFAVFEFSTPGLDRVLVLMFQSEPVRIIIVCVT